MVQISIKTKVVHIKVFQYENKLFTVQQSA